MRDISQYEEIIIWGAAFPPGIAGGDATSHGRAFDSLYGMLLEAGYASKIIFIADSNKRVTGMRRNGIEVRTPQEIKGHPRALVIINSISIPQIRDAMRQMGLKNDCMVIPYYFYHGTIDHPYDREAAKKCVELHREQIRALYDIEDEKTARYMDIILRLRERCEDDLYDADFYAGTGGAEPYFCDDGLAPGGDVTYIDVGAYTGDSIEPVRAYYKGRLKKIYAFEPDARSREELGLYLEKSGLVEATSVMSYALGPDDGDLSFSSSGATSVVSLDGEERIEQRRFDGLPGIDTVGDVMVKMDIEGAEMGALRGMAGFIQSRRPYLAICIYHREEDLYDVPMYLKSLYEGYRFFIRGGWHLECWAVPERHFTGSGE